MPEIPEELQAKEVRSRGRGCRNRLGDGPLSMLAVSVTGADGLDWLLLTMEGGAEKDNAVRIWRRWMIEE